jgi:hypothetical protein
MPLSEVRKIQRRAKQFERDTGHWALEYDGPDPLWSRVTSTTGRTGHITNLQMDVVSMNYAIECKNVKVSATIQNWWRQIQEVASKHGKEPLLVILPSNPIPNSVSRKSVDLTLHIITPKRHAELLEYERRCSDRR